jgi:predicted PurR-regulated permease PerM
MMKFAKWIYILVLLIVIGLGIFVYRTVFSYILASLIFAYILNPVVVFLEKLGMRRVFAILSLYIGLGLLVAWGVNSLLPQIIKQAESLFMVIKNADIGPDMQLEKIPFVQDIKYSVIMLQNKIPFINLTGYFASTMLALKDFFANFPQIIMKYSSNILTAISFVAAIPLIGFFLLKDDHLFIRFLVRAVPNRYFELTMLLLKKIDEVAGKYLRAMMIEIVIVGSLSSIVLTAMGISYGVLIGVLAGFTNIIPYFGPLLGAAFGIISVLISGKPLIYILYVIIGMYGVQFIDNNFIYPIVVGKNTNMHPLIILLTVMAGGFVFGIVGMLFSVPVVFLVYSLIRILHQNLKAFEII